MKTDLQIIKPRGPLLDEAKTRRLIRNLRSGVAKDIAVDFNVTTQTWTNSPKADIREIGDNVAEITMSDERYIFVNEGTRPHPIRPRNVSRLVFQANYQAKTVVRQIASQSGGSFGPTVYSRGVQHPGTEGRHFDDEIAKKWNRLLPAIVDRMILAEL